MGERIKWSKELIIEKILERYNNGLALNIATMLVEDFNLYNNAKTKRYFGSWKNAIESAGLNYNDIKESDRKRVNGKFIKETDCLAITHPNLVSEWHISKNGDLSPNDITHNYSKKVWWICENGHEWERSPSNRTNYGNTCPLCKSLAFQYPEIAKEWHPTKNGKLSPWDFFAVSNKSVWWICDKGHEWKTPINKRIIGRGCHECKSGLQTSFPEQALYYYIRNIFPDAINRYLYEMGHNKYEIDIFIPECNIGIEYDGEKSHLKLKEKDEEKSINIINNGINLIRIRQGKLPKLNVNGLIVIEQNKRDDITLSNVILNTFKEISKIINKELLIDVNISRDRFNILEKFALFEIENSLAIQNPKLASEWHPTKNGKLLPIHFLPNSNFSVWWKCENGHEWESIIAHRNKKSGNKKGNGCPFCSGRNATPEDNFTITHPQLLSFWDFEKNKDIDPKTVKGESNREFWWKCDKGHEWKESLNRINRRKNCSCPNCIKENSKKK